MPRFICPTCKHSSLDPRTIEAPCPVCGFHDTGDRHWEIESAGGNDMRRIAQRQRWLLWITLSCVASYILMIAALSQSGANMVFVMVAGAVWLGSLLAVVLATIWMSAALPYRAGLIVLFILTCWMPLINLLVLLYINNRASHALRRAGLRVGFMGVKDDDVVRRLSPYLCLTCGYDLTGNVSGICPECGSVVRESATTRP